jgi:hypothetical protein
MIKDFLFFNHSWVPNSTYIFKCFEKCGYSCDYVDEKNILDFVINHEYKVVVLYLGIPWTVPIINNILENHCKNSFIIQHDDTDNEHVQQYYSVSPHLVMQREMTDNTCNPYDCPVYPHHFPIPSMYDETLQSQEKEFDVMFLGTPSNPRRQSFINRIVELSQTRLSNIKWFVRYQPIRNPSEYFYVINKTKIGLNYPGNSYDSWRTWELASAKVCTIQPELKVLSTSNFHMPYNEYIRIREDHSDLEEKIIQQLENDKYKEIAELSYDAYNKFHTPEKCFEKYHDIICKYAPIKRRDIVSHSALEVYEEWRKNPNT